MIINQIEFRRKQCGYSTMSKVADSLATLCIIASNEDCVIAAPGTCLKCLEVKLGCEIIAKYSLAMDQLKEWQSIKPIGADFKKDPNSRLKVRGCSTKCECARSARHG
jgi:hypothetical protein